MTQNNKRFSALFGILVGLIVVFVARLNIVTSRLSEQVDLMVPRENQTAQWIPPWFRLPWVSPPAAPPPAPPTTPPGPPPQPTSQPTQPAPTPPPPTPPTHRVSTWVHYPNTNSHFPLTHTHAVGSTYHRVLTDTHTSDTWTHYSNTGKKKYIESYSYDDIVDGAVPLPQ